MVFNKIPYTINKKKKKKNGPISVSVRLNIMGGKFLFRLRRP